MGKYNMHGGVFSPLGYTRINTGGSHETNPNGGVQLGVDPNGIPNMVEEGESVYKDFVYSDNIYADGGMLEKHNLPKKWGGLLYSEVADKILADIDDMTTDEIALRGMEKHLQRLADAQEEQKAVEEQKRLQEELANLSPEEMMALQGALAEQGVPEEQIVAACGGKLQRRFAEGGNTKEELFRNMGSAWGELMMLGQKAYDNPNWSTVYPGTYDLSKISQYGGYDSIKDLEDSMEYQAFTKYVLTHPKDYFVDNYLSWIDAWSTKDSTKLKDKDGNLKSNWRDIYKKNRTDGKDGIYHFSGNNLRGLLTSLAKYDQVDPGYFERGYHADSNGTSFRFGDYRYLENHRTPNQQNTNSGKPATNSNNKNQNTRNSAESSKPGIARQNNIKSNAAAGLAAPEPPRVPNLEDPDIQDEDLTIEEIGPGRFDTRAEDLVLGRMAFDALGRARYDQPASPINNPFTGPVTPISLDEYYGEDPEDEFINETTPRYRMPSVPSGIMGGYVPESILPPVQNPFAQSAVPSVDVASYAETPRYERFNESVPRYRMPSIPGGGVGITYNPEPIFSGDGVAQRFLSHYGLTPLTEPLDIYSEYKPVVEPEVIPEDEIPAYTANAPRQKTIKRVVNDGGARQIITYDDGTEEILTPEKGEYVYRDPKTDTFVRKSGTPGVGFLDYEDIKRNVDNAINEAQSNLRTPSSSQPVVSGRQGIAPNVDLGMGNLFTPSWQAPLLFPPVSTGTGQTGPVTKTPSQTTPSNTAAVDDYDWRRYADAYRNLGTALFNIFQKPDELNVPVARNRFVNTPIPNFINPVYRPTDPNLVTGDVLAAGAGAARAIRGSGNPITAGANLAALDSGIVTGLGKARTQVDEANNTQLNNIIAAKNNNILQRSNAMYQQARDRANYLAALDQYNINNNLRAQQYKHAGEAAWAQAISAPLSAATKFISDDYLEDRRRNLAKSTSIFGYWVDQNGNRHYLTDGLSQ